MLDSRFNYCYFGDVANAATINGTYVLSGYRFKIFIFVLIKKVEGCCFKRLLTPLQPLSLTPLNKKKFDFQGSPLWFFTTFKICTQIIRKYPINILFINYSYNRK